VAITEDIKQRRRELDFFGLADFFQSIDIVPRSTIGKDFSG